MAEKADNGYYYNTDSIGYARYSAEGSVSDLRTAEGVMASDCTPIVYNGQVVWYATDDSVPVFYVLDEDGVTAYPTAGGESEPPAEPEQPERPSPALRPVPIPARQPPFGRLWSRRSSLPPDRTEQPQPSGYPGGRLPVGRRPRLSHRRGEGPVPCQAHGWRAPDLLLRQ